MQNTCYECRKEYYLSDCEVYFNSKVCQQCRQKDFHKNSIKPVEHSLWAKKPNIAKQWVRNINTYERKDGSFIETLPIDISFRGRRECYFYCSNCKEIIKVFLNNISRNEEVYCYPCVKANTGESNARPKGLTVFDSKELLELWDFEKNNIEPKEVALQSNKKYFWVCSEMHSTLTSPANRHKGRRCITCMEKYFVSAPERELQKLIENFYKGIIEFNRKKYIHPYELDIVLPEIKIAIEFNGVYFHSDKKIFEKHGISSRDYHLMKKEMAKDVGLDLLFIWEDDWYNNKEEIIKTLKNRVLHGKTSETLKRLEV